ncbi:uncharacterized protein LOC103309131 [Acyrthosiphon pisum]|uniref:Integrase catalytic domain-containing protein n=3 Tax=Acyrthosiphon pisum TaxID=7029 RepID=A0A8R2B523_ACYPI|nr:uncharacterized protein LOC103309131 [Acyrthosiphon pisum]|eukprot:XP_008182033.1 PREDICTED: uncharacterized protein LOC103309131 [Acyrthosiphon pisum]
MAFRCLPIATRELFETTVTSPGDYPTIEALLNCVQSRVSTLEIIGDSRSGNAGSQAKSSRPSNRKGDRPSNSGHQHAASLLTTKPERSCPCCKASHSLDSCGQFLSLAVDERSNWMRENSLCFNCFSDSHWSNKCRSKPSCKQCSRNHHTLLHMGGRNTKEKVSEPKAKSSLCASHLTPTASTSCSVMLGTALVHVRDRSGTWQTVHALVDCASQISAVTVSCADRLGLKRTRWTAPVTGLAGHPVTSVMGRVDCIVQPRFAPEPSLSIRAWVLPSITGDMPHKTLHSTIKDKFSNLALADPSFNVASSVDMLLGADVYATIMNGHKIDVGASLPSAFNSVFGWILIGPVPNTNVEPLHALPVSLTLSIEEQMNKFWDIEEPEAAPDVFTEEGKCESIFRNECIRLPSGRFSVPLPFRSHVLPTTFAGSRLMAVKRFESLERKLLANPQLQTLYKEFMDEYLALGHMSIAPTPGHYFVPHHAIYKADDGDAKIRVVFDASARCSTGPSLNSCLLPGKKLQQDIIDVLTRFRIHQHAFTADICKMYRQIQVLPEYRKYQHILWRSSPHDQLVEYQLNTVTYGVTCAPFLAIRVLHAIAETDCTDADQVRDALLYQTYVDDICVGSDSVESALELQSSLQFILAKSGLELKKWSSNTPDILSSVPASDRVCTPLPFNDSEDGGTKVLGLQWNPNNDFFSCALRFQPSPTFTKRGVLSLVARIFDPLGLFGPTVFWAKCIMQRTWQLGLEWDDPLPPDIHADWSSFLSDLPTLSTIRVARHFGTFKQSACYLMGFCDASQLGYAAVVYVLVANSSGDQPAILVGSKTKLALMKPLSIPRLELNAALLLARWLGRIKQTLDPHIKIVGTYGWTDSMIVLSWLTVPHTSFKVYVSNRIHQIRTILPDCQWSHIESTNNPADCASRGVMPSELTKLSLYWQGPAILRANPSTWIRLVAPIPLCSLPEVLPVALTTQINRQDWPEEWFNRFSSYDRMIRVTTLMHRFINHCRRTKFEPSPTLCLNVTEVDCATRSIIRESQSIHFCTLLSELSTGRRVSSKPLARLAPFVDDVGIIRVGGRLRHSTLSYGCKHPILIAKRSHLALLICRRWHRLTCHSGPRVMISLILRQYWIVAIRSVAHDVLRHCSVCVRLTAKPPQPLMADLPAARVQQFRPFARVGVDYAGPLQMRELKLRKSRIYKVYIAVFVCFSVKAVHLELVSDLSTDAFLAAFDRFVGRRGLPCEIFSDCGTNFIGADKQLQALITSPQGQLAITTNSRPNCKWHFNPPSAPHFGGLWEAAVRSTKRLLVRTMSSHVFTYEEFTTVLIRIEAVLNSRPLTPASTDPHDLECLTPGHFLIGQPLLAVPPRSNPDTTRNLTNRWKLLDQCHQAFWKRWSTEYLTTLQERVKWTDRVPNLKVNDMVVVVDNQAPPLSWRLGRIMELVPGPDGTVRVASVLTPQGRITRPVVKLVVLPTD